MKNFVYFIKLVIGIFIGCAIVCIGNTVVCGIYDGITTDNVQHQEPQQIEEQQIQEELYK